MHVSYITSLSFRNAPKPPHKILDAAAATKPVADDALNLVLVVVGALTCTLRRQNVILYIYIYIIYIYIYIIYIY
jgi:hypothetical protein